jgi:AraC-like DNA-binding protein
VLSLTVNLEGIFEGKNGGATKTFEPGGCFARDDTDATDLDIPGASMLVANVDTQLLRETARKLSDVDPPREADIGSAISLVTQEGSLFWRRLAALWRDLRQEAPLMASPRAVADAEAGLAEAIVDAMGACADRARDCGVASLRRAEEFILGNLRNSISRADVCAAAGVSARSLSRQFARRHGVGPMGFLKRCRLEAIQRSLGAADPVETSVTDVATAWGLYHFGRFAVEYKAAFGESPHQTLRR